MDTNTDETTSASPAGKTSEPTSGQVVVSSRSRKFRSLRTFLLTFVVLVGIGGALVVAVLASRPTWHTVLSDGKPGSLVIAIDCPDNWKRINMPAANARTLAAVRPNIFQFKRQPPTGLLGWWMRVVLHQDDINQTEATIMVMMVDNKSNSIFRAASVTKQIASTGQGTEIIANIEQNIIPSVPGYRITKQRVQHPLGPALHIVSKFDKTLLPNAGSSKITDNQVAETWYIVPQKAPANSISLLSISCSSPESEAQSLKSLYAEVIQRVHLVKKP